MGTSLPHRIHLILITFVVMELCIVCSGSSNTTTRGVCREAEKRALLCFKKEANLAPMNWVDDGADSDCCTKWEGVVCDSVTGHVIQLHLSEYVECLDYSSKGKLSPCLLELKQLRYLDLSGLSGCLDESSHIPSFIVSFANLQFLDLSGLGFQGIIPHRLGNLTSLHTLRLPNYYGRLKADNLDWLSNLSKLELLDLSYVNLSMAHNWPEVINMLPSLRELYLYNCDLPKPKLSHPHHLINSSLLVVLDLSWNKFNSVIPRWIFNLKNLVSLDLTSCGFLGQFPNAPWNLTSLTFLNISENLMNGTLPSQLFGLSHLESLNIRSNQFQGPLPHVRLWNLTSLTFLDISGNLMNGSLPSQLFGLSHLESLNIRSNQFQGPLPHGLWNLSSLRSLDVSGNELNGSLPSQLFGLSHLESLIVNSNHFQGLSGLGNLTSLQTFEAFDNPLNSNIPNWIYNCKSLVSLDLHNTRLQGTISNSISNLTSLSTLDLSGNNLTGNIPNQIGKLSMLGSLDLSENKFYGPLPESLGYWVSLTDLRISNNMLEGIVTENHFVNLTRLTYFEASGNRLTLNVSSNWMPPFQLESLKLSGWNLGSQFPAWLKSQHSIGSVDISNTGIKGEIPTWLWKLSSNFQVVNISHNQLLGNIESIPIQQLNGCPWLLVYLGSNQFSGSLPRISINITELDLSDNSFSGDVSHFLCHAQNVPHKLRILHFGGNHLSGEIPDCWMHWKNLNVINLGENKLSGSIPNTIGLLNELRSLDLHKNMLSGHIPSSLQNCASLLKVDLGENGFTGKIPRWLGTKLSNLTILRLRVNNFSGELPPEFCHLTSLQILDLANNNFSGVIPKCLKNLTDMIHETREIQDDDYEMNYSDFIGVFQENALVTTKGNEYDYGATILLMFASMDLSCNNFSGEIPIELTSLVGLRSLNLSRNDLIGNIPMEMGNMNLLESLDLSRNQLSGEIPSTFSSLNGLGVLDLSYNNLSGKIPSGTQLQGFNASCYVGNNLCGPPVSKNCSVGVGEIPKHESNEDDDDSEVDWFYVSMAIGFAVGLWVTCGSLFLVRSWRIAYFQFLDNKFNSFLVWARGLWY